MKKALWLWFSFHYFCVRVTSVFCLLLSKLNIQNIMVVQMKKKNEFQISLNAHSEEIEKLKEYCHLITTWDGNSIEII